MAGRCKSTRCFTYPLLGTALGNGPDWEDALWAYQTAAEFEGVAANAHYNAACLCAKNELIEDALAHVELALEAGFSNRGLLLNDPDLASLQNEAAFRALVPPLKPSTERFEERPRVLHTLVGEAPGDVFGWIGRNVGDADGDGRADLLISAPWNAEGGQAAGKIYVYSGATGELLHARAGKAGETLGIGIEAAGDVNGDGLADSICGAANVGFGPGVAYVYSGKDGSTLLTLTTGEANDALGRKVSGGVDFDADGHDDVLVGAPGVGPDGSGAGRAHVFSGKTGEVLATLAGKKAGDAFGAGNAVWSGDGISEVYASDWQNAAKGASTGRIYVHSGADGERLCTLTGHRAGEGFGTCTADVGDVDGDGLADLLVGAWQAPDAAPGGGKCYLYSRQELIGTYTCNEAGETFGFDTTGMGDLDGDGGIDFLVTGGYSTAAGQRSGRVFVLAGPVPESR